MRRNKGKLYVISGPSGTGKGTICTEILKEIGNEFSVSMTTRSPRPGEVHGKDYFFVTKEEFEIIKSHTVQGGEILSHFKSLENAGEGALYHHERYDGSGYPEGKAGEDIPLIARIICVADAFDAMNTDRVYRTKRSKDYIIQEIEKNKGHQFDPAVADVMLRLLREDRLPLEI